jgi:hypothetical protein
MILSCTLCEEISKTFGISSMATQFLVDLGIYFFAAPEPKVTENPPRGFSVFHNLFKLNHTT